MLQYTRIKAGYQVSAVENRPFFNGIVGKKIQYEAFGERIATGLFFYCLKREF